MRHVHTLVIGGGQAGLAMSRCLTERGLDHVVLERGRVGERWRSERWDSLRLLTPNWMSRLPGHRYDGADPDGFMSAPDVVGYLEGYARRIGAPVHTGTTVRSVRRDGGRFLVDTDRGRWSADTVVVATGACDRPHVPSFASDLPDDVGQVVPSRYRNPDGLAEGGVLVVGASATGVQLADEIHASGRPVTLAVGRHIRLPRGYRGRDIMWWLDRMGVLDETFDRLADLARSRSQPSLQLVGRPDHRSLDLPALAARGVRLAGRAIGVAGDTVTFAGDLAATTAAADHKLRRLLERIDAFATGSGLDGEVGPPETVPPVRLEAGPTAIDLRAGGIRTVVWATGYRRGYPWLHVPVLDASGEIRHTGGVTPVPGLYVLGLTLLRRRKSTFIDGVGADASDLADHIVHHRPPRPVAA